MKDFDFPYMWLKRRALNQDSTEALISRSLWLVFWMSLGNLDLLLNYEAGDQSSIR
jgi:hypothetical protein